MDATRSRGWLQDLPWDLILAPVAVLVVVGLYTPVSALFPHQGDVELYWRVAAQVANGQLPYRDFAFPYPPVALVSMLVPFILWPFGHPDLDAYHWLFLGWEAILLVGLGVVVVRIATSRTDEPAAVTKSRARRVAVRLLVLSVAAALPIAWRFDLLPALLTALAVWAAIRDRPATAGLALALGTLAKAYPVVLIPIVAAPWLSRGRLADLGRFVAGLGIGSAVVVVPFALASGTGMLQVLDYQADRGLQLESVGAGIALLAAQIGGPATRIVSEFSSMNVAGSAADAWLAVQPAITIVVLGAVGLLAARVILADQRAIGAVRSETILVVATVAVLGLLVTNKVFSTQYVVWLLPFAPFLRGWRFWIAVGAIGLSSVIHPSLYDQLIDQDLAPILVLNARNLLLVVLLAWQCADLWQEGVARPAGLEPTTFRSAT